MRVRLALAVAATLPLCAGWTASAFAAASADTPAWTTPTIEGRVIVKFKAHGALASESSRAYQPGTERAKRLSSRLGTEVVTGRVLTPRLQVLRTRSMSSAELVVRLAQDPDIEYVVEDVHRDPATATTNDTAFDSQWYLGPASETTPSAINVQPAWDISHGTVARATTWSDDTAVTPGTKVNVAVIDTGVRFDHEDLRQKLLPGYDMVSNDSWFGAPVACTANDGDGRDNDASDPGDGLRPTDIDAGTSPIFPSQKCSSAASTWHGTEVAGILAAQTDNALGIAGIGWDAMILPVRALGRCGGYDSDIIASMLWAAGLPISDANVPVNPNPARVVNLSISGKSSEAACPASYLDAITALDAKGVIVVAAAGNGSAGVGESVSVPGRCAGVIAVGGLTATGLKAKYANFGAELTLSAPSGDTDGTSEHTLVTTTDAGEYEPQGSAYTSNIRHPATGTSFAAPMVSGVVALMLGADPRLNRQDIVNDLKRTARLFPTTRVTGTCSAVNPGECRCTPTTCGAGMLDAGAAVAASRYDPHPRIVRTDAAAATLPKVAIPFTLSGLGLNGKSASLAPFGASIVSYQWTVTPVEAGDLQPADVTLSSPATATTGVTLLKAGRVVITLTVTDSTDHHNALAQSFATGPIGAAPVTTTANAADTPSTVSGTAATTAADTAANGETGSIVIPASANAQALACTAGVVVAQSSGGGGGASSALFLALLGAAVLAAAVLRGARTSG